MTTTDQFKYIPLLRPASFCTLPRGVKWEFVEVPSYVNRFDLPASSHTHGVIATDRKLTADECDRFDLRTAE